MFLRIFSIASRSEEVAEESRMPPKRQQSPNALVEVSDEETATKLMKVLDALDDLDDVVNVHTSADITIEV